jgi:predicted enzyme related to lactoylglutathione lyase
MTDPKPPVGSIGWCDLTVEKADTIRDFYKDVVGWTATGVDMGGYSDYAMNRPDTGDATTGICWARGANKDLPPVWMVYFIVSSLKESLEKLRALGGTILREPGTGSGGRVAIVRDPAGAVCALYEA